MGGRPVPNEDLVALPNWLVLEAAHRRGGADPAGGRRAALLPARARRSLRGCPARAARPRPSRPGDARCAAAASSAWPACTRRRSAWTLTPHNWSGRVEVISALDGRVMNRGVARYRQLEGRHLDGGGPRTFGSDVIALKSRTRQSSIEIAEAARTRVYGGEEELEVARSIYQMRGLHPAGPGIRGAARRRRFASRRWWRSTPRAIGRSASPCATRRRA